MPEEEQSALCSIDAFQPSDTRNRRGHSAALGRLVAVGIKWGGLRDRNRIGRWEGVFQRVIKRLLLALARELAVIALSRFALPIAIHFEYSGCATAIYTLPSHSR